MIDLHALDFRFLFLRKLVGELIRDQLITVSSEEGCHHVVCRFSVLRTPNDVLYSGPTAMTLQMGLATLDRAEVSGYRVEETTHHSGQLLKLVSLSFIPNVQLVEVGLDLGRRQLLAESKCIHFIGRRGGCNLEAL
jgi:hypothetical protein